MAFLNRLHNKGSDGRRATFGEVVIAEAAETVRVEGNDYFPPDTVDWERLVRCLQTTVCPWKGVASYYDVVDGDRRLPGAAWVYEDPSPAAAHIKGHVAFWRGVSVGPVREPD